MILADVIKTIAESLWSVPAVVMLLGVGLYLTWCTRGIQFRQFTTAWQLLLKQEKNQSKQAGEISSLQALSVALAGTVGAGNITGVATAISFGGPGAIFWMWLTAVLGMATTYSSCYLSVKYREQNKHGHYQGGPMYVLRNALKMRKLASIFAVCAIFATIGSGNMIPANAMMQGVDYLFPSLSQYQILFAISFAILVGIVVIGGVKRIGLWMGRIVPLMCIAYLAAVFYILILHFTEIPHAVAVIFNHAFNPWAIGGGGLGYAIQYGVARGLFSNEAGQGSLPMIHALAKTNAPESQAKLAMLGPFIDTVIVCTLTALVIILTEESLPEKAQGAQLALYAFQAGTGVVGTWVIALGLILFSYSTIVAWAFYGESAIRYLFPDAHAPILKCYRYLYSGVVILGATLQLELVWNICDIAMVLMMVPNLISLVLLKKEINFRQPA